MNWNDLCEASKFCIRVRDSLVQCIHVCMQVHHRHVGAYIYMRIYDLFTCQIIHSSILQPIHQPIQPSILLSNHNPSNPFIHSSICPSIDLSIYPPIHSQTQKPVHNSPTNPSIHPPVYTST